MASSRRAFLTGLTAGALGLGGCASVPLGSPSNEGQTTSTNTPVNEDGAATAGVWTMDGHDPGRTGSTVHSSVPTGDVVEVWSGRPGTDLHSATGPVVGPDRVYIGYSEPTETNGVYTARVAGFDARSGAQQMDERIGQGRIMGLAMAEDRLVAVTWGDGSASSQLVALSPSTGSVEWEKQHPDATGPPALTAETMYLATRSEDNAVYAYSIDGTERWRTSINGRCYNTPCVDQHSVYVGLADGRIAALAASDGSVRWTEPIAPDEPCCPDIQGTPTVAEGRLYVPGIDEHLYAVDTTDGSTVWSTRLVEQDYGNAIPSPAVVGDTVYVNTYHGGMLALETSDGSIRWRSSENGTNQQPAAGEDAVVFPRGGRVAGRDASGEDLWTFEMHVPDAPGSAAYIMNPEVALAHDLVYISVHDGRVFAVGPNS